MERARHLRRDSAENTLWFFTDGSVTKQVAGASAILFRGNESSGRVFQANLNGLGSSTDAEIAAIKLALFVFQAEGMTCAQLNIVSDSQGALRALRGSKGVLKSVTQVRHMIREVSATTNVTFVWTPSHCEVEENDAADEAAKAASVWFPAQGSELLAKWDFPANLALIKGLVWKHYRDRDTQSAQVDPGLLLSELHTHTLLARVIFDPKRADEETSSIASAASKGDVNAISKAIALTTQGGISQDAAQTAAQSLVEGYNNGDEKARDAIATAIATATDLSKEDAKKALQDGDSNNVAQAIARSAERCVGIVKALCCNKKRADSKEDKCGCRPDGEKCRAEKERKNEEGYVVEWKVLNTGNICTCEY
ncbi:hypothetical protein BSKO_04351 [Bryopsis sp. KO-2023]|nr:hypothetical protein BSKO_04351 [Bryopsis sp. KO-2023]